MENFGTLRITEEQRTFNKGLVRSVSALVIGEPDLIANLSNTAAIIYQDWNDEATRIGRNRVNWVGFYLLGPALNRSRPPELVLGPFQGRHACIRIRKGKGVVGTVAQVESPLVIGDVHTFPGHIACDASSESEVVVPIFVKKKFVGVLDIDSPVKNTFSGDDLEAFSQICTILGEACTWPDSILKCCSQTVTSDQSSASSASASSASSSSSSSSGASSSSPSSSSSSSPAEDKLTPKLFVKNRIKMFNEGELKACRLEGRLEGKEHNIVKTDTRSGCALCYRHERIIVNGQSRVQASGRQTSWKCERCDVRLCLNPPRKTPLAPSCFKLFHTLDVLTSRADALAQLDAASPSVTSDPRRTSPAPVGTAVLRQSGFALPFPTSSSSTISSIASSGELSLPLNSLSASASLLPSSMMLQDFGVSSRPVTGQKRPAPPN
eukprot:CAMPEP_0177650248 /NCGR_PEP_ID=MMETSP0447-20121125/11836_1 /TAXON_ID=0 /ORGANISM="Stygamoeba regulata, Strain BSH-02190019" /LENGTH=436 /DNA_ID=CAMNT_0019153095 /DNA_START=112 /DNA_END=1422 /DNA_ORIENTATION=-